MLLPFLSSIRDIVIGTLMVTGIVLRDGGAAKILISKRRMTSWEAHLCTASPGSIAYPCLHSQQYIVEEWVG